MNSTPQNKATAPAKKISPQNIRRVTFDGLQIDLSYLHDISGSIESIANYMISQSGASGSTVPVPPATVPAVTVPASTQFPDYAPAFPEGPLLMSGPTAEENFLVLTDFSPDLSILPVQQRCGERHWHALIEWCQDMRTQLESVAKGTPKNLGKSATPQDWEEFFEGAAYKAPRLLERLMLDVRATARLAESGATLCGLMSDFGYSPDGRPSLLLSLASSSLRKRTESLEKAAVFLQSQVNKLAEVTITKHEADAFHLLQKLFANSAAPKTRNLKIPVVAALIGLGDDQTRELAKSAGLITKPPAPPSGKKPKKEHPIFTVAEAQQLARLRQKPKNAK